jgi:hypothetical protein
MKTLLNVILLLAWLGVYLGIVYAAAQYRRTRARVLGLTGRYEYRAERDLGLWCVSLVTGVALCAVAFFGAKMFGALP